MAQMNLQEVDGGVITIDLSEVRSYQEAGSNMTLKLKSGEVFNVKMNVKEFVRIRNALLMSESGGNSVRQVAPISID